MLSAPGTTPPPSLEQALDLEVIKRLCVALGLKGATDIAVKLKRKSVASRAVTELANELERIAGSAEFNSYLSVAEGDSLAATALGDIAWNKVTEEIDKEKALVNATIWVDTLTLLAPSVIQRNR